jgi:DNA-binding NtrC family response regulator
MKSALLLDQDVDSCARTAQALKWLGYAVAPIRTAQQALSAIQMLKFDLIVTSTAAKPDDRRSLTGELKRSAPATSIVLIADERTKQQEMRPMNYPGVSAVVKRPASLEALRKAVEYQLDYELLPARFPQEQERRRS